MGYFVFMVTLYRAYGLRVVIFVDDHEPAHVHVFGDGQAKINLIGDETNRVAPRDADCRRSAGSFSFSVEADPWLS
jgi:Domain of unknown function (DUF4160)